MAKKRKATRTRKAAKPKASAQRKPPRQSISSGASGDVDPMNVVAVLLVLILVGLGIFYYQTNQNTADTAASIPAAQVEKK